MSERENTVPSSDEQPSAKNQSRPVSNEREDARGGRHNRRQQNQPRRESSPQTKATINMDELREVIGLVSERGFTDFEFENADIRIRLRRELMPSHPLQTASPALASQQAAPVTSVTSASLSSAPTINETPKVEELETIPAPIVGTFYRSPSPTSDPFVRTGESVEPDSVVCIIEAMKLMNEIQAETTGVIEKIYVENGQPVEFGQPLFGVRKV